MDDSSFNLDIFSWKCTRMLSTEKKFLWKCGKRIFSNRYHFIRQILAVGLSSIDSLLQIAESKPAPEANTREPIGEEPK